MNSQEIIEWLLQGGISVQYQVYRDLLRENKTDFQNRISTEGWGKAYLSARNQDGGWGQRFYQPKWTSTHYTLLDLRNLCLDHDNKIARDIIEQILETHIAEDGGIILGPSTTIHTDACVNGMFLNYASWFRADEKKLHSVVDSILNQVMPDGGFNCESNRRKVHHSSLHTTISVLEGIVEFIKAGYTYRSRELERAKKTAEEFILQHQLFLSDRTGEIINTDFLKLTYPHRWRYDVLRALDYFRYAQTKWDTRMQPGIDVIQKKRKKDGRWFVQSAHPGKVHFIMETAGSPSRWITLKALRVLNFFRG